jgi:rhodanese-related sulfurtransferase
MHTVFQLSIDQVNASLGQDLGEAAGLDVQTLFPKDGLFPDDADGLIIDLDHVGMTPLERAQFVYRLNMTLLPYPVAVHSYNLEAEQIEALEARGVLVFRRLELALFRRLARAIADGKGGDAAAQYDSLTRLLRLPDWVAVFPGHFEGPCGKGMCGRPSTTLGFERLYNPLARLDRTQFIARLTQGMPPRPLNMTAIEATNRGLADMPWAMLTASPPIREVGVEELESRQPGASLLDVREPEEYAHGHVPGAVNLAPSGPGHPAGGGAARSSGVPDLPRRVPVLAGGAVPAATGFRGRGERQGRHRGLARGRQAARPGRHPRRAVPRRRERVGPCRGQHVHYLETQSLSQQPPSPLGGEASRMRGCWDRLSVCPLDAP